ncbi:MAG: T9SS type B sorting domain-containing protein [Eudoraea sp.]|nr:T9SS type B sorting domain-containing protein [Eudoraea sp.]
MRRPILIVLFLAGLFAARGQLCPEITFPMDGALDISIDATITWPAVSGINGYVISLGTSPGGTEILNSHPTGQDNFYTAPLGLPDDTQIFVSFNLIPFDGPPVVCAGIVFNTEDITSPPPCTILTGPDNDAANVTIVTDISWSYASSATGYLISIGTSPGGAEILSSFDVGNVLIYEPPADLPQFAEIYVQITPFNENGSSIGCSEESFFTGPAMDYCEPFTDEVTGEIISLRPEIDFPDIVGICSDELPFIISSKDAAEGFRWYRTNSGSPETLLSEQRELPLTEPGRYRYEIYNSIVISGIRIECANSKLFDVVVSEIATINAIDIVNMPGGNEITIRVSGRGDYEYALDNSDGPYQGSPVFSGLTKALHTVYVRDKNGCGIAQRTVDRDLTADDFPNFFTPNGDGINDFWQFVPPEENFQIRLGAILIFDRYGSLLAQFRPDDPGWDGKFQGTALPASDYWFKAFVTNGPEIHGHFALKR